MKQILIDKLLSWSQEKADLFHGNIPRDSVEGKYYWEYDDRGVFLIRNLGVHYCSNDGKVYTITTIGNENDWKSHVRFYDIIKNTNVRIDIPISFEQFKFDSTLYFYKEFNRPNNEYGRDYHLDLFDQKVDDSYFKDYIDDVRELLVHLKFAFNSLNINMPLTGITPFKRMRDSKGIFYIDFKNWSISYDLFVEKSIETLNSVIYYLESNNLGTFRRHEIISYSREKWNTI